MPEALTESFCERCGTRYEFAAPTRLNTIRKTRGLISGLRNYIMSQDALSDAVGDAMRSEEEVLASQQLDAFHQSFNFCIQCRQYACTNCWNESAGRCRTCVPIPGTDDLIERFEASFHAHHPEAEAEAHMAEADLNRRLGLDAWPTADLSTAPTNGHGADWPVEELRTDERAAESPAVAEPEAEPAVAEGPEAGQPAMEQPAPEQPATEQPVARPEPVAAESEQALVEDLVPAPVPTAAYEAAAAIAWEDDHTFELEPEPIAALPADLEAVVAEAAPEVEDVEADAQAVAEVEVDAEDVEADAQVVAEVEAAPEAEVVEAETEHAAAPPPTPIRPISETLVQLPRPAPLPVEAEADERMAAQAEDASAAAEADDASLAARRAKLDLLGIGDPGEGSLGPDRPKVMPYRSSGAAVSPVELAAHRQAQSGQTGTFWEASAREVAGAVTQVGVQACGECGLSLSASARFCRRCGTRQARSA